MGKFKAGDIIKATTNTVLQTKNAGGWATTSFTK